MQTIKHWAQLEGDKVVGIRQIKSRNHVDQADCVEITSAQYNNIRSKPEMEFTYSGGKLTSRKRVVPYYEERKGSYPDIGEQLDALWKELGPTLHPGSPSWGIFQKIKEVKQNFPKPDNHAIGDEDSVVRGEN
jgi:hypothetical protein